MIGLFERIGEGLEMVGLAVEGAVVNAKCEIANAITDIEVEAKCRKYEREAKGYDDNQTVEEEDECKVEDRKDKYYKDMLEKLAQHEDAGKRNPVDIAIELGYSEEEVKEAFEYLQQKMKVEEEKEQVAENDDEEDVVTADEQENVDAVREANVRMSLENYFNQFKGKPNKTNWLRAMLEAGDFDEDDDDEEDEDD